MLLPKLNRFMKVFSNPDSNSILKQYVLMKDRATNAGVLEIQYRPYSFHSQDQNKPNIAVSYL